MDRYCRVMLTVIAASLVVIATNLSIPALSLRSPVFADLVQIEAMDDSPSRNHQYEKLLNSMPLVYVHKGNVTAEIAGGKIEVTGGTIEVSGSVQIDDASSGVVPIKRN